MSQAQPIVSLVCSTEADPTFEGLKQLKYEPGDRVRIQQSDPTPLKSNSCVTGFRMDGITVNEELSLADTNFPLSNALVAVTGGKGAGKTALVDLLANLFKDRCNSKDSNSFVRRVTRDGANFETAVTFGDGTLFKKTLTGTAFVEQSEIVYIAQGELEDYIGENSDLDRYIRDLIFESPEVKSTVKTFEFEKLAKRVRELEGEISQKHQLIEKAEGRTAENYCSAARREKTQLEAESRDIESKIPGLESRLTKEKIDLVTSKQATRSMLQIRKSRLVDLGEQLVKASQFVSEDLSRFNLYVTNINGLLRELNIQGSLTPLEYTPTLSIAAIQKLTELELSQVVAEIEVSAKELQSYEAEMQEHARYLSRRNELSTKLAATTKKLETIAIESQQLETERRERDNLFRELLRTVVQQQEKYSEIIAIFGSQKAEVLSDLDFKADIQFAGAELLGGLEDVLDNRQVEVVGKEGTASDFQRLRSPVFGGRGGRRDEN